MEEEARCFLSRFVEEFPAALEDDHPLPVNPLSRKVSLEELHGESLDLGLRLLSARAAPSSLSALLCQAALSQLLKDDLSSFHCPCEAEVNQEEEEKDGVQRAYYAVFDGHGGLDAAVYAATHLHVALSKQEMLQSDSATAFKSAFKQVDDMFRGKAKRECLRSGSTGVAVLIQGQELTVAWLGDSQALLVRRGEVVTLMDPHKPEREDEKQRIEDLGGCIAYMGCWRVNGTYAVSRAIGDFDQKPYVSGDADCSTIQLLGDEDYVLLACDGFFDAIRPSEVPCMVVEALQQTGAPEEGHVPQELFKEGVGQNVAQRLVGEAKAAGSSDNITVMVVFLRPPDQLIVQHCTTGTVEDSPQHPAAQVPRNQP
ncbi:protein phosphatase 1F [Nematolebias whitei]|uniref:protein phosphatase 1F n=1 Tax=Nematolebias whitei TaxID=451745 RepID=UPI00189A6B0C|nr:protein phosphatase 1F [Nematolebias whitei]